MAIINNVDNPLDVKFGLESDVCYYCLKEYYDSLNPETIDVIVARENLKGRLTGKKIWKNKGANNIVICPEHLQKIYKEVVPDGEE